jgi:hypothetical protein
VYKDFAIVPSGVVFEERNGVSEKVASQLETKEHQRTLESIQWPQKGLTEWTRRECSLIQRARSGVLRLGNVDGLTRKYGNLYVAARPLRAALYHRLGIKAVQECMPIWQEDEDAFDGVAGPFCR